MKLPGDRTPVRDGSAICDTSLSSCLLHLWMCVWVCVCLKPCLLCLWCNIVARECLLKEAKKKQKTPTCSFLFPSHFSLSWSAISQRAAYRFSPPFFGKMKPEIVSHPSLPPSFLSHVAGCSSTLTWIYVMLLLFLNFSCGEAVVLFNTAASLARSCFTCLVAHWQHLSISHGSWFQIDMRNPCWHIGGKGPH